jgi:periplasmic protein TonB
MRRRLFEDLVVSAPPTGRFGRRAAILPLSIAAHAGALAAALLLPALGPAELPSPLLPEGPIVDWGPAPPTPPPLVATPPPARITKSSPGQASAPTAVADPVMPAPAPGPIVSTIEPTEVLPESEHPPCFVNCEGADRNGIGNGPPGPTNASGNQEGTGTGPIRITGGITPPVRTVYVAPVYPEIARMAGVNSIVILECTIDPSGRVTDVRVLSGHPLLNESAMNAVRQWRYTPTRLSGVPVAVLMTVTVRYIAHR